MSKHIQLHIPEPCHENWDRMTSVEKGRFCGSCQKQVMDFTTMSDTQLAAFFKKPSTGTVCGRFMQRQLHRTIDIPKKRIPWVKYFFQFALPAFLISSKAVAQGKVRMLKGTPVVISKPIIEETENSIAAPIEKIIRGRVIDDNNEGIPYASVSIKGTMLGVAADSAGNFSLKYSGVENSLVLISSCAGFQETESTVNLNSQPGFITISLVYNYPLEEIIFGVVIDVREIDFAGAVSVEKTATIIDTICNKIFPSKKALKLYPNPVKRNTPLAIEIIKQETGTYLLQLSALNGQVLLSKEIWVDKNSRVIKLDIASVAAGTYLVSKINKQSGKTNTEKIIVE